MAESLYQKINRCFMRLEDRAERIDLKQLVETFVEVGPLLNVLESKNNQIMYGRRGTGKTHALKYFGNLKNGVGDISIYIDCQNIGSNQSIYDDKSLPLAERATRLLVDVLSATHWALLETFSDPARGWDLSSAAPMLDSLVNAISEIRVVGTLESEITQQSEKTKNSGSGLKLAVSATPEVALGSTSKKTESSRSENREKREGTEQHWVDFNYLAKQLQAIAKFVHPKRIWICIDEWSTIPDDIQPYLADLIRRTLFGTPNVTVKIAAIEHRSNFKLDTGGVNIISGLSLARISRRA